MSRAAFEKRIAQEKILFVIRSHQDVASFQRGQKDWRFYATRALHFGLRAPLDMVRFARSVGDFNDEVLPPVAAWLRWRKENMERNHQCRQWRGGFWRSSPARSRGQSPRSRRALSRGFSAPAVAVVSAQRLDQDPAAVSTCRP